MEGYIYLVHAHKYRSQNRPVYKIGESKADDQSRLRAYGTQKQRKVHCWINVANRIKVEQQIIDEFNKKFILIEGREWFEGNLKEMMNIVRKYTQLSQPSELFQINHEPGRCWIECPSPCECTDNDGDCSDVCDHGLKCTWNTDYPNVSQEPTYYQPYKCNREECKLRVCSYCNYEMHPAWYFAKYGGFDEECQIDARYEKQRELEQMEEIYQQLSNSDIFPIITDYCIADDSPEHSILFDVVMNELFGVYLPE